MKPRIFLLTALALVIGQTLFGQSFLPQNLGPEVNSSYDDINPVISPDNKTLYFIRVNHPENTFGSENSEDIWYSTLQADGSWSQAQRIPSLNIGRYNAILSLSQDGNVALLNGIYNKKGNIWKKRGLSVSTRTGDVWNTPVKLTVKKLSKKNSGLKSSGAMSADGKTIILSYSKAYNSKKTDLFVTTLKDNGNWRRPRPLRAINTGRSEITPFLLADGKTLYYSSDELSKGAYDIYKVTRLSEERWKKWSSPVRVNDTINSPEWDAYFKTNSKGSWAYFSSANKSVGGADIFKVKVFEENPFVLVKGQILNAKTNRPLLGKELSIAANGIKIDSAHINKDSATYKILLPLKKVYTLTANAEHYSPKPEKVDVSSIGEFTRMTLDLKADPTPYVLVKGKMLVRSTGLVLPAGSNPKVFINNKPADSVIVNNDGTYAVRVPHGTTYTLQLQASDFNSQPSKLDLSKIDEYQEVPLDLYAEEEKMAVVTGKIIDKKTGKGVASSLPVSVRVEGRSTVIAKIDTVNATYEAKLPLGSTHTISASASNYYPLYEVIDLTHERTNVRVYKDLVIVPIEVGQSIRLNNIFFESGKSTLKKESFPELDRVADFMTQNDHIKIEIGGHTDNVGKAATNMKLSEARAKAVAAYVISKGIAKDRIVSKGYGMTKPVAPNKTAADKAQNRRVEFIILDK